MIYDSLQNPEINLDGLPATLPEFQPGDSETIAGYQIYTAAQLSVEFQLPMADSFILATARSYEAVFWTQDEHFRDIPDVKFIAKK